jgi:hypothetical protein
VRKTSWPVFGDAWHHQTLTCGLQAKGLEIQALLCVNLVLVGFYWLADDREAKAKLYPGLDKV